INLTVAGTYQTSLPGSNTGDNSAGAFAILPSANLTIENASGGTAVVDGGGIDRVFDVNPQNATPAAAVTVTLAGFTIQNGKTTIGFGGGIQATGAVSLALTNMVVTHNSATAEGGGIFASGPSQTVTISNSTFTNNSAGGFGGGISASGPSLTVTG